MIPDHNNVPDLSRAGRVQVQDIHIIPQIIVEVLPGGIPGFGGDHTLRIIDIAKGRCDCIPYQSRHLAELRDIIDAALKET